ncbi:hypothetical protein Tsubulata_046861 [Turnera subulata]|uniref:Uncharacterized protein n=1 Tax=Turnera subulata TaxID=218843 RepID=A0A9Q0FY46_9ROSI|nr:hypothetical protein Tsubulata_046861 [Turnera subulata]
MCREEERTVGMHELIQQMCEDIVFDENRWDPRKRSRLWRYEDVLQVLNKPKGAERVEALSLDMSQIRPMQLSPKLFEEMDNLRLLRFYFKGACWYNNPTKLHLPQGLEYIPNTLRLLHWDLYPSPSLPLNFCPENMVYLKMPQSSLTQLWEGDNVHLVNLKVCDLSRSKELIKIMNFWGVPNLEELNLKECSSLVEIPSSIQLCRKLTKITVSRCDNLRGFPSDLSWTSLEEVNLQNCPRITRLPDKLPSTVKSLYFGGSGIKQSGVCFHHKETFNTETFSPVGVEAEHVIYSCTRNIYGLDRAVWGRFETPMIPGVQVIKSGVQPNFYDDFEKLKDEGEEEEETKLQYIIDADHPEGNIRVAMRLLSPKGIIIIRDP